MAAERIRHHGTDKMIRGFQAEAGFFQSFFISDLRRVPLIVRCGIEHDRHRLIDADWQDDLEAGSLYKGNLNIFVHDQVGVLIQIAQIFSEGGINLSSMSSRASKNGTATINVSFDVKGRRELNRIIEKMRQLDCVIDVERTTG